MVTLINSDIPRTKQYEVVQLTTLSAGTPGDQFIAVDPRKITVVEIHADSQNYTLSTATIPNSTNDLEDASQLWFEKESNSTADFQSGEATNRGFVGIRLSDLGTLTSDFTFQVAQYPENDEKI